jgi:multiple sugar transport system permease protein
MTKTMALTKKSSRPKMVTPKKWGGRNGGNPIFYFLPAVLLLLVFFIGPVLLTFYFAFTNLSLTGAAAQNIEFVGFENFVNMFQDPAFRKSIFLTIVFLVLSAVVGQQALGLILALLMREKKRSFRRIIGTLVIAGWVTPEIVVAFIFVAFFSDTGTVNAVLGWFGMEKVSWLFQFPMACVVIANIWHGTAFSMLVYQSALGDVPKEIEEAAQIDGASLWQSVFRITLPMIKGAVVTNMVLITLQTLGVFTLIFAMTGGGPGHASETLPIFMYNAAFVNFQLGYGTAISLILLLIGIIASLIYMRTLKIKI